MILKYIFLIWLAIEFYNLRKFNPNQCRFVITSIVASVFATATMAALAWGTAGVILSYVIGASVALLVYGGIAFMLSSGKKQETGAAASPTYGSGTLQSQTNNSLPIPLLYGKCKVAGNRLWQADDVSTRVKRLTSFAWGEIEDFTDIRLNDIKSTEISGISIEKFKGTATQNISAIVQNQTNTANTNAQKAEVVGGLRNHAYLAIDVPRSDKIDGSYNLTTICKGLKVRKYTNENTYTTEWSDNPAWCLLDFLTNYNGGRLGVDNDGNRNDSKIKDIIDINSFIESAAYCDEIITSYQYTTALTGANNDLIWIGRHANRALTITYTAGASASIALVNDDITVKFVTGVTTANDIISLVASAPTVASVVKVYTADDNTGVGVVSTLAKTSFIADNTSKRFTFNMIFDSQWTIADVIEEFKKNCRGALIENVYTDLDGKKIRKYAFSIDKPEVVGMVIPREGVIQGSETVKPLENSQRYDILEIEYIEPNISDPENESGEWAKCRARAVLDTYHNEPAVSHSVQMYSVIDFKQASRNAWYYLNRNIRCNLEHSFATEHRGRNILVGMVITYYSDVLSANATIKVTSVSESKDNVFTVTGFRYDADIYNDELASLEPIIVYNNLNDPYAYPSDVTNFNVVQNKNLLQFSWTAVEGTNITYEIRQGTSWQNSSIIGANITDTNYIINASNTGTFTYLIKAKKPLQYSQNATSDVLNIDYIPELNEVVKFQPFIDQNGFFGTVFWQTLTENWSDTGDRYYADTDLTWLDTETPQAYFDGNELCLLPNQLWQTLDVNWQNDGTAYYRNSNGFWDTSYYSSAYYTTGVYDVGSILTSVLSFDITKTSTSESANYILEYRISDDNTTWGNWTLANVGQYTFRYIQMRITMLSPDLENLCLSDLVVTVDVPDRQEVYTNREIINASNGITITYATDIESKQAKAFYITEPHIVATSKATNAYAVVTSSTANSCTVKLYNNSGTLTTGFVNISAYGY